MVCDKCKKNIATYHSTVSINGIVKEEHLCSECASKSKNKMFEGFNNSFFNNFFSFNPFGYSYSGISNNFISGKGNNNLMSDAIDSINKGAKKYKADYDKLSNKDKELNLLKQKLQEAVTSEDYEKAAEIKKQIDKLKEE